MARYCGWCFAHFPYASLEQHELGIFDILLTSDRSRGGWMKLLSRDLANSLAPLAKLIHSYLFCQMYLWRHSCCGDYGDESAVAHHLRVFKITPLLKRNGIDVFSENLPRIARDLYHGVIEIILLYLQGWKRGVIRPLPALSFLRSHGLMT